MATRRHDVVVVGAGPNGLTAAARLARSGRRVLVVEAGPTVGGGSRTAVLDGGWRVDTCAAVHPLGVTSPAFEALGLAAHGLTWRHPPVALAHPFDDGTAAVLHRDLDATVQELGADGRWWRRLVGPLAVDWGRWQEVALATPLATALHHPLSMARFGAVAGPPVTVLARAFREAPARALLAGLAAHTGGRLGAPTTAGAALVLAAAAHAGGMPVAAGGSQSIVDALATIVREAGGDIECGRRVDSLADLPPRDVTVLDLTPGQAARLLGRRAPRWRHGVAAWKLDLLLAGPLPWLADACHDAGTVHLGGTPRDVALAERAALRGGVPAHPFVIVAQPSIADPTRAPAGHHVVWAYRHVPNGCADQRATAGIEAQLDRFAPGWRELEVARRVTTPAQYARYDACYVGGDVAGGAMSAWQTIARPRLSLDPYHLGDRVWLCSQSTPPGPGVHGMCGWHAAASVLARS